MERRRKINRYGVAGPKAKELTAAEKMVKAAQDELDRTTEEGRAVVRKGIVDRLEDVPDGQVGALGDGIGSGLHPAQAERHGARVVHRAVEHIVCPRVILADHKRPASVPDAVVEAGASRPLRGGTIRGTGQIQRLPAAVEAVAAHLRQRRRKHDAIQALTIEKGGVADGAQTFRQDDLVEAAASLEGAVQDLRRPGRKRQRFSRGARPQGKGEEKKK
jgi:hypothetical protein